MLWKHKTHQATESNTTHQEEAQVECEDVSLASMFGPFLKNYTNCLAHGQQITKMPYPINFYFPNSSLQHQATIQMSHVDLLMAANLQQTPILRFLCVVQYALSTCSLTKFPYKPIIGFKGETAHHHVSHSAEDQTHFLGEQISREPPTSCFYINNPARGVTHTGNIELCPKFNKTHVAVNMKGEQKTTLVDPYGRWREEYFMEIPDFAIRLLRMHTELTGGIAIACPANGLVCTLNFKDKPMFGGHKNVIVGKITMNNVDIATLEGMWDDIIRITDSAGTRDFFNRNTLVKNKLEQPAEVPVSAGHKVWEPLVKALTEKDYKTAQAVKDKLAVENEVRENNCHGPAFFRKEGEHWQIVNPSLCSNPVGGISSA
eukprot:TRINITY_DN1709_c0_g1_i1.p1 TRINITY_DN1709_c0_g1~~TRINITY_DN1709_c0_g1_i1.p1  ORF type:complete len:374 (+),score=47.56 TRINITY_DN1709_c0_g1_i1:78-1199(+)